MLGVDLVEPLDVAYLDFLAQLVAFACLLDAVAHPLALLDKGGTDFLFALAWLGLWLRLALRLRPRPGWARVALLVMVVVALVVPSWWGRAKDRLGIARRLGGRGRGRGR